LQQALDLTLSSFTNRESDYIFRSSDMSNSTIIAEIEAAQITRELAKFSQGDTVVVSVKSKEGNRERLQAFEGVVIAKRNRGLHSAFYCSQNVSHGVGVERTFQSHSPLIASLEVKASWRCASSKTVLPPRLEWQSGPDQGKTQLSVIKAAQAAFIVCYAPWLCLTLFLHHHSFSNLSG
jgi:large subunit ribosomal protein L19